MPKVTMEMTQKDIDRVDSIAKMLNSKTKADAVGGALDLTSVLLEKVIHEKGEILIKYPDGKIDRVLGQWG